MPQKKKYLKLAPNGDFNGNGFPVGRDVQAFGPAWYQNSVMPKFVPGLDLDYSGQIGGIDLNLILERTRGKPGQ